MTIRPLWLLVALAVAHCSAMAVTALHPLRDDEVLEQLPSTTRQRATAAPTDPASAASAVRQDIALARQTGDTRYWGRAQAQLAPWWGHADAPADLAVLQATVQQGRHEFNAARQVLVHALARAPQHAQGWLNLAALERVSARYPAALDACDAVARAGQPWYAAACRWETRSLQGQQPQAHQGLQALLRPGLPAEQQAWLLSLLAESQERAGQDSAAQASYQRSLAQAPDLYTSMAYSDLLLRTGQLRPALQALATLPATDAVLLRRATAWRRLGDSAWRAARTELQTRHAELLRRGDDPALHAREQALAAWWLDDQPATALVLARHNLQLQREPLDWWVALHSARAAQDASALADITQALQLAGLQDQRLSTRSLP